MRLTTKTTPTTNGVTDPDAYRGIQKSIHSSAVASVIDRCDMSRALGGPRPSLSRAERTMFAQTCGRNVVKWQPDDDDEQQKQGRIHGIRCAETPL